MSPSKSFHQFLITTIFSADSFFLFFPPFFYLDTETNVMNRIQQVRFCQNQHTQDMRWSKLVFLLTLALVGPGEGCLYSPRVSWCAGQRVNFMT